MQQASRVLGWALVILAGGTGAVRAVNLVQNPSFELDSVPADVFTTATPLSWSPVGGGSDILDAGYSGGTASDGEHFVDLIGGAVAAAGGPFPSGIQQSLTLQAGVTYRLSFDYNGDTNSPRQLDAALGTLWSDSVSVSLMNAFTAFGGGVTTPWGTYTTTVTPLVTGSYMLSFTTAGGSFGSPYLDNVVVEAEAGPVPEGSGVWGAAGVGLVVAGRVVRRRVRG